MLSDQVSTLDVRQDFPAVWCPADGRGPLDLTQPLSELPIAEDLAYPAGEVAAKKVVAQ
jgi:hypothetical protein